MSDLLTRAQLELLAKQLNVPTDRISHLERFSAAELKELHVRISDIMFDSHADMFRRICALVPIVPLTIVMPIIQKICPPEMGGKAAGAVALAHPKKVATALSLLKPDYAATAAPYLDPRAVRQVAHLAPAGPVVAIANEILARRDYVTAGQFVDAATPELIVEVEKGIHDDAGLIQSGAYVFASEVLSNIIRVIASNSPTRLPSIARTLLDGTPDLQMAGLSVFSRLDPDLIALAGDILIQEGDDASVGALFRTFIEAGAREDVEKLLEHASPQTRSALESNALIAELGVFEPAPAES